MKNQPITTDNIMCNFGISSYCKDNVKKPNKAPEVLEKMVNSWKKQYLFDCWGLEFNDDYDTIVKKR